MTGLADLPGLTGAKRLFPRLATSPSIHAVLLYGSPGSKQSQVASALGAAWLCHSPGSAGACGVCNACLSHSRGNNPDIQVVEPFGRGDQIKVTAINRSKKSGDDPPFVPLRDFTRSGPLVSANKVVILGQVDRMNHVAANAFLKLLEEPNERIRFLLWTSEIGAVIATIVSRCLAISCELPNRSEVDERYGDSADIFWSVPHLAERFAEDRSGFDQLLRFTDSLSSKPLEAALRLSDEFRELVGDVSDEDAKERTSIADSLELLAVLVSDRVPEKSHWVPAILKAHRRIVGNVNARSALDALFVELVGAQ